MPIKDNLEITCSNIRTLFLQTINCLKTEGIAETFRRSYNIIRSTVFYRIPSYSKWMKTPLYTEEELEAQKSGFSDSQTVISIITPLYNTNERFLREMIESVVSQTYSKWELCLADGSDYEHEYISRICQEYSSKDPRIKYLKLNRNYGIIGNSNHAVQMSSGDYIALLDHDDLIHPSALYNIMQEITNQEADFIYTDEMTFISPNIKNVSTIHFKPDYAPDNLRANNYICHLTAFKRTLLGNEPAFREGYEGSQDHDLFLRLTSRANRIVHIPKVLYYWRAHPESTADSIGNKSYAISSGIKAVSDNLNALGLKADVESAPNDKYKYRIRYTNDPENILVSIIIPNYDHVDDLKKCIDSIKAKTTYPNYEIVIVENNSKEQRTFDYYEILKTESDNIRITTWNGKGFNWSAINNHGVRKAAKGDYLLFLNNDTEVITPEWIEELLMYARRRDVGVVGAMLYYPDDTIQHAGIIVGMGNAAEPAFNGIRRGENGYMGRLCYAQNYSAVTGACMMVRRSIWDEVDGFDEDLAVSFNDVDFCLKVRASGYLVVWTPFAELYHYEFRSRGLNDSSAKISLTEKEVALFRQRWKDIFTNGDPYYNANLSLMRHQFTPFGTQGTRKNRL